MLQIYFFAVFPPDKNKKTPVWRKKKTSSGNTGVSRSHSERSSEFDQIFHLDRQTCGNGFITGYPDQDGFGSVNAVGSQSQRIILHTAEDVVEQQDVASSCKTHVQWW